jgi:hypothetical protein
MPKPASHGRKLFRATTQSRRQEHDRSQQKMGNEDVLPAQAVAKGMTSNVGFIEIADGEFLLVIQTPHCISAWVKFLSSQLTQA